ncbi:MAG: acyl-CoA dehydrogenase family protein, partial [Vicinamibacterales bacterium]
MDLDLSVDQQSFLDPVTRFSRDRVAPAATAIDEEGAFPLALVRAAFALGLAGVTVPREFAGGGRDYVTYALAVEA